MGARKHFGRGVGGGQTPERPPQRQKRPPIMEKKIAKRPPHGEKGPHMAEMSPIRRKT